MLGYDCDISPPSQPQKSEFIISQRIVAKQIRTEKKMERERLEKMVPIMSKQQKFEELAEKYTPIIKEEIERVSQIETVSQFELSCPTDMTPFKYIHGIMSGDIDFDVIDFRCGFGPANLFMAEFMNFVTKPGSILQGLTFDNTTFKYLEFYNNDQKLHVTFYW